MKYTCSFLIKIVAPLSMIALIFSNSKASAQTLSLTISPPILEVMIKPGKSITQVYKLTNNGDPAVVVARIVELGANGIEENPAFALEPWIGLLSSDVTIGKPFLLTQGKTKEFILKVNPPEGTPERDYYRVLAFTTKPNPAGDSSQSQVSETLGSPLLITTTKTGFLNKNVKIVEFDMPKIIDSFGPVKTTIAVANTGTTYTRPVGTINLKGMLGAAAYEIIPRIILQGQRRSLATEDTSTDTDNPTLKLPGFYFGPYELKVQFTLDSGTKSYTETRKFYALPWKLLLALFVFLLMYVAVKKRRSTGAKHEKQ